MNLNSNYVFKGAKVSMAEHWDGENYMLIDNKTTEPILIGTREQILAEYDKRNNEDIPGGIEDV